MLPGLGILQTSALRSGVFSWGFPAAASQKVFGIKVGSGETADISCREGSGCSFGWCSCPLGWGDKIPSSTPVIFGLGDLEPIAWLKPVPQFLIPFAVSVAGLSNDDVSDGASRCGDERLSSLVAAGMVASSMAGVCL